MLSQTLLSDGAVKVWYVVSIKIILPNIIQEKYLIFGKENIGCPDNLIAQAGGIINAITDAAIPPVRSTTNATLQVEIPIKQVAATIENVVIKCRNVEGFCLKKVSITAVRQTKSGIGYVKIISSANRALATVIKLFE